VHSVTEVWKASAIKCRSAETFTAVTRSCKIAPHSWAFHEMPQPWGTHAAGA